MTAAGERRGRREVYVVAAAAASPFGLEPAALLAGLRGGGVAVSASTLLAASHPGLAALGVGAVPAERDPVPAKARKTMSRGAYLGAVALRALMRAAGWSEQCGVGYFLGVGASGGSMSDLEAILSATLGREEAGGGAGGGGGGGAGEDSDGSDDGGLDLARFGTAGIPACNPLLAFQLMNNFTMCHGAILEGTTGPSGAFFSRGAGTVAALIEAREAVAGGDCERAIAGGADSALHPVTWIEHQRLADTRARLPPGEGAGLLALASAPGDDDDDGSVAIVIEVAAQVTRADDPAARAAALLRDAGGPCELIVIGADDAAQRDALAAALADTQGAVAASVIGLDGIGVCLAATPAIGWVAAIEALRGGAGRAAVVTLDGAGDLAVAVFARREDGAA